MSWTVACFCGTVFESPAISCPTCDTPVPEVTRGAATPAVTTGAYGTRREWLLYPSGTRDVSPFEGPNPWIRLSA